MRRDGTCDACDLKLEPLEISTEQFEELRKQLMEKVRLGVCHTVSKNTVCTFQITYACKLFNTALKVKIQYVHFRYMQTTFFSNAL